MSENFGWTKTKTVRAIVLFEHSLALPFFGIGVKLIFSGPVATAEFSKFAGILSAAYIAGSQHIAY